MKPLNYGLRFHNVCCAELLVHNRIYKGLRMLNLLRIQNYGVFDAINTRVKLQTIVSIFNSQYSMAK